MDRFSLLSRVALAGVCVAVWFAGGGLLRGASAQAVGEETKTIVLRGGGLFDATDTTRVENPGIVVRAGKIVARGETDVDTTGARIVDLEDDATILPGLIDLHAHYAVDLFG